MLSRRNSKVCSLDESCLSETVATAKGFTNLAKCNSAEWQYLNELEHDDTVLAIWDQPDPTMLARDPKDRKARCAPYSANNLTLRKVKTGGALC